MKKYLHFKILFLVILLSTNLFAQEPKELDLSKGTFYSETVDKGTTLKFRVINKIPSKQYKIITVKENKIPRVLELPADLSFGDSLKQTNLLSGMNCDELPEGVEQIWEEVDEEEEVPYAIEASRSLLTELEANTNPDNCTLAGIIFLQHKLAKTAEELPSVYVIEASEKVEVTVLREVEDDSIVWKYNYESPMAGRWVTTYGFSFAVPLFDKAETYYLDPVNTSYIVTEDNQKIRPNFLPSIFFSWLPNDISNDGFSFSWTGGLGFNDLEAPTVFLGGSVFYYYNLSLNFGIVAHKQHFLIGKYSEGQILKENMSFDQLHDEFYSFNPFLSLSFRFGKNIFEKGEVQAELEGADDDF